MSVDCFIEMQFGHYKLLELINETEITRVYKAYDLQLECFVTLKLLTGSKYYSEMFIERFLGEVKALAQLSHSNISKILDFGQDHNYLYIVSEYTTAPTLAQIMDRRYEWRDAIHLLLPVAQALEYAHKQHVIHRDLKPAHITIDPDGQPLVSEFSVARIVEEEETRDISGTTVGLGSPDYMSPEQGKGMSADYRADIYSFGVILFEMITGSRPFTGENGIEVVIKQVTQSPPRPTTIVKDLPLQVEKIILKTLQKDPEERYQSMGEVVQALQDALGEGSDKVREQKAQNIRHMAGVSLALCLLGAVFALAYFSELIPLPWVKTNTPVALRPSLELTHEVFETDVLISTPIRTATKTRTELPVDPTPTRIRSTSTPSTPIYTGSKLPPIPVLNGHSLPRSDESITVNNVENLTELARWGQPQIYTSIWSSDGNTLIGGTGSGVYYYDGDDLSEAGFFDAGGIVSCLDLSSDGKWLATGDMNGNVAVWETASGSLIASFSGHSGVVTGVDFSPNNRKLVSVSRDKRVIVWDIGLEKEVAAFDGHLRPVTSVRFVSDDLVISGGEDSLVYLWNPDGSESAGSIRLPTMVLDLSITSDQKIIAIGMSNATVELWSLENGTKIRTLDDPGQVHPTNTLSISPGNELIATGANDGTVRIWNITSGVELWQLRVYPEDETYNREMDKIIDVNFSPEGTRLSALTSGGEVFVWDLSTQHQIASREMRWYEQRRVEFSPNGRYFAYQNNNETVFVINLLSGKIMNTYTGTMPRGRIFSQQGKRFVIRQNDVLHIFELSGSTKPKETATLYGFPPGGYLWFFADDRILAAASNREIVLWSTVSIGELQPGAYEYINNCQVAYSEQGEYLAAGSILGVFENEDAASFFCTLRQQTRTLDADYLPDGSYYVAGWDNNLVELWDRNSETQPELLSIADSKVLSVALSPGGDLLAVGTQNGLISIVSLEERSELLRLVRHNGAILDLAFSPDGKYLATASYDGTLEIWGVRKSQ